MMMNRLKKDRQTGASNSSSQDDLVMELTEHDKNPVRETGTKVSFKPNLESGKSETESTRRLRLLDDEITNIKRRNEQTDSLIELNRTTIEDLKNEISQINVNIKDLLAIYEFVSQQFNPFKEDEVITESEVGGGTATPITTLAPPVQEEVESITSNPPLLTHIPTDHLTNVIVLRWLEFLLQRVRREHIPPLFDYYAKINWVSDQVKDQLLAYIRGEVPDITAYEPDPKDPFPEMANGLGEEDRSHLNYKVVDEWRLSADDHLKTYLFIQRILGHTIDKNELNQVELEIRQIKGNLKGYYGL